MILNNQEWLLAIFKKKGLTPTGKLEFATIDGIDSALAQALNEAFDSQVVSFNDRLTGFIKFWREIDHCRQRDGWIIAVSEADFIIHHSVPHGVVGSF